MRITSGDDSFCTVSVDETGVAEATALARGSLPTTHALAPSKTVAVTGITKSAGSQPTLLGVGPRRAVDLVVIIIAVVVVVLVIVVIVIVVLVVVLVVVVLVVIVAICTT